MTSGVRSTRLDDADRLVSEYQAGLDGILATDNVHVVPQMVVAVMRMTVSPTPGLGLGTSSTARQSLPLKTTAFIVVMLIPPLFNNKVALGLSS